MEAVWDSIYREEREHAPIKASPIALPASLNRIQNPGTGEINTHTFHNYSTCIARKRHD